MKKPVMFGTGLAAAIFAGGYVVGQLHSPPTSSAANQTKSLALQRSAVGERGERWAHRFGGPRAFGKVTALSGPSSDIVTIKPFVGPRGLQFAPSTIKLTNGTRYYSGRRSTTTADAVKVGVYVAARGTLSSDKKTLTASVIMVLPTGPTRPFAAHPRFTRRFEAPAAIGRVTAVAGNTISLRAGAFSWRVPSQVTTVVLTGSTRFFRNPFASTTRSAVKVGVLVAARGTVSKDGKTLTAQRVVVVPGGLGRGQAMWRDRRDMRGNDI